MPTLNIEQFSEELRRKYKEEDLIQCTEEGMPLLFFETNGDVCPIEHFGDPDPN